jgi:hypothetical protein
VREGRIKLFEIKVDEIERLTPYTFPELMKKILRTELTKLKLKQSDLVLSLDIHDPDGGLDAYLGCGIPPDHTWLPQGKSGWQFKAVTSFSVTEIENEVLNEHKNGLKPRIDKLLEANSTYVLAISGKDYVPNDLEKREKALKDLFGKMGYQDARAKVYSSGQIADWASSLPSVVAYLKPDRINFKDFSEWEKSILLQGEFVADNERSRLISEFRNFIIDNQKSNRATILRLVGLSGVGKTRLAFETLSDDFLRDIVLYLDSPEKLPANRFNEIAQNDDVTAIIVVDECSNGKFIELAREAEPVGGRLTLITLDFDIDMPRDVRDIHQVLSPLDNKTSEELVKLTAPSLPETARRKIIEFSVGYPIILKKLAENFATHPDILSPATLDALGINSVLNRIIVGRGGGAFPLKNVRAVLSTISIFKRLGWDDDLSVQGQSVCESQGINWLEARRIAEEQEKRKLIAKRGRYRYVTPLPLAINLSSTWLKAMDKRTLVDFFGKLDLESQKAFLERLADLGYTEYAKEILRNFLSSFNYKVLNTSVGSEIFLSLSKADHSYAMDVLNNILAPCSRKQLLEFKAGRRNIVWALEKIAWWKDTFESATNLLIKLADAENETWSNNATGVFISLFQTYLGGTEVPIWERFNALRNVLFSDNQNLQKLAIKAIGASLNLIHAFRSSGAEEQGIIIPPPEWNPKNREDIVKAVNSALGLIDSAVLLPDREIQITALELILSKARELIQFGFVDQVLNYFSLIQQTYQELIAELIRTVENIIHYDEKKLPETTAKKVKVFRDQLIGKSYHDLMVRYVMVDLLEDHLKDGEKAAKNKIRQLAIKSIDSPELLENELNWLITNQAKNAYFFGRMLGDIDEKNQLFTRIRQLIEESKGSSILFYSGYLSALKIRDELLYRQTIDKWLIANIATTTILEIIWRSGASDWDAAVIIKMLKENRIAPAQIQMFLYGAWFKNINIGIFVEFLREFINIADEENYSTIIGIIDQYVESHPQLLDEKDLIITVLSKSSTEKTMDNFYWNRLLKALTEKHPETIPTFVDLTIEKLHSSMIVENNIPELLSQFLERNPEKTWLRIKQELNSGKSASWRLAELIRGEHGFGSNRKSLFNLIPEKYLWDWVEENPTEAPYLLARMIPLRQAEPNLHPMARELILKFKDDDEIKGILIANWYTEGFTGKASDHYKYKLSVLQEWAKDNERIISSWAKEEAQKLKQRIHDEEIREEERDW